MLLRGIRLGSIVLLLAILALLGWRQTRQLPGLAMPTSGPIPTSTTGAVAVLLFPSSDSLELEPVVQRVSDRASTGGGLIGEVVQRLLAGPPVGLALVNPFPAGTRLLGWDWVDRTRGVLRINLSAELVEGHVGGTSGELATVYSLVNTVGLLSGVHAVELWVEGRPLDTLAGHLDLSGAIRPDLTLVDVVALRELRPAIASASSLGLARL